MPMATATAGPNHAEAPSTVIVIGSAALFPAASRNIGSEHCFGFSFSKDYSFGDGGFSRHRECNRKYAEKCYICRCVYLWVRLVAGAMPRSKVHVERKNMRIPKRLMDEVDWIVNNGGLYLNRQQFIESAIREKVERLKVLDAGSMPRLGLRSGSLCVLDEDLVAIKESFLVHTIMGLVNGKGLPSHHSDSGQFGEKVRSYLVRKAEIEGRRLTEEQLDELTECLLKYHDDILEGLRALELVAR